MNLKKIILICLTIFVIGAIISILLPLIKWLVVIVLALFLSSIVYNFIVNIKNKNITDNKVIEAEVISERESN